MIKLSILIANIPSREKQFLSLYHRLDNQLFLLGADHRFVEIISDNSIDYNIGVKRNKLLHRAKGEYIVFIDDDDEVSNNYISLILNAIESNPDCVAIKGIMTTNGINEKNWLISKEFGRWYERKGVYYRTPNHISPVRRELALKAGFPEISHGEDYQYSMRLFPLLKTETIIQEPIYHYKYISHK